MLIAAMRVRNMMYRYENNTRQRALRKAEGHAARAIVKGCKVAKSFTCEARVKWASPSEIVIDKPPIRPGKGGRASRIEVTAFAQQCIAVFKYGLSLSLARAILRAKAHLAATRSGRCVYYSV